MPRLLWGLSQRHVPLGARGPLLQVGNQVANTSFTSSPNSELEESSYNPANGSFTPLAF